MILIYISVNGGGGGMVSSSTQQRMEYTLLFLTQGHSKSKIKVHLTKKCHASFLIHFIYLPPLHLPVYYSSRQICTFSTDKVFISSRFESLKNESTRTLLIQTAKKTNKQQQQNKQPTNTFKISILNTQGGNNALKTSQSNGYQPVCQLGELFEMLFLHLIH